MWKEQSLICEGENTYFLYKREADYHRRSFRGSRNFLARDGVRFLDCSSPTKPAVNANIVGSSPTKPPEGLLHKKGILVMAE